MQLISMQRRYAPLEDAMRGLSVDHLAHAGPALYRALHRAIQDPELAPALRERGRMLLDELERALLSPHRGSPSERNAVQDLEAQLREWAAALP